MHLLSSKYLNCLGFKPLTSVHISQNTFPPPPTVNTQLVWNWPDNNFGKSEQENVKCTFQHDWVARKHLHSTNKTVMFTGAQYVAERKILNDTTLDTDVRPDKSLVQAEKALHLQASIWFLLFFNIPCIFLSCFLLFYFRTFMLKDIVYFIAFKA